MAGQYDEDSREGSDCYQHQRIRPVEKTQYDSRTKYQREHRCHDDGFVADVGGVELPEVVGGRLVAPLATFGLHSGPPGVVHRNLPTAFEHRLIFYGFGGHLKPRVTHGCRLEFGPQFTACHQPQRTDYKHRYRGDLGGLIALIERQRDDNHQEPERCEGGIEQLLYTSRARQIDSQDNCGACHRNQNHIGFRQRFCQFQNPSRLSSRERQQQWQAHQRHPAGVQALIVPRLSEHQRGN